MKTRRYLIKQLTAAEAGTTNTNETYIRCPNDFDYESFFQQNGAVRGTVKVVLFQAKDLTSGASYGSMVNLRFAYYFNNINKEKRIPGLTLLFRSRNVVEGDFVKLISTTESGTTSFSIQFFKPSEFKMIDSFTYYEETVEDDSTNTTITISDPLYNKYWQLLEKKRNLVLTGAPGTGKTYLAKAIAEKLGAETQFVQFHPSYDYTDFVEGLRPRINDDSDVSDGVSFIRKDGIFKSFCKKAILYSTQAGSEDPDEVVPTGSFEDVLNTIKDDIKRGILDEYSRTGRLSINSDNRIQYNREKTKKTILETNVELLYNHFVEESEFDISAITKEMLQSILEQLTSDRRKATKTVDFTEYKWTLQELLKRKKEMNNHSFVRNSAPLYKPFVFIIDEINRGELSKIFGELFSAIEPDYRGEKGLVSTQYQELITDDADLFKRGFYVPNNVFIIGTMNDIDRGVESMDFAIRRRFAWKEVTAEESASNMNLSDFACKKMRAINKSIKDHELSEAFYIGGAYFRSLTEGNVDEVWEIHLKGLVSEYFRGNPNCSDIVEEIHQDYIAG